MKRIKNNGPLDHLVLSGHNKGTLVRIISEQDEEGSVIVETLNAWGAQPEFNENINNLKRIN